MQRDSEVSINVAYLTSFWVLRAPKSWLKYFFSAVFKLFCSFQTFFGDFTAEINKKCLKKNKKRKVFVYSSSWLTC